MKQRWRITQWLMVVFPMLIGALGLLILPDRIPAHLNSTWEITRWGSKYESLIWIGLFFLINLALLLVCKRIVRNLKTVREKQLSLWVSFGGMLVMDILAVVLLCVTSLGAGDIPSAPKLPLMEANEDLLTYEKGRWPQFYLTPESEGEPHPFDGYAAFNAFEADLNNDGKYEAYATIHLGSGVVTSYLLGHDPVTGNSYTLNERMVVDYEFIAYEGELYIRAIPFFGLALDNEAEKDTLSGRIYRPKHNDETLCFDLEEIDPDLAEVIQGDIAQEIG